MSKDGKLIYRGLDGEWYESIDEKVGADNRWEQQQQQNQLLAQQNELIARQNRDNERLAREQMINSMAIEKSRQMHDKEMRLLALCDTIGINKTIIDNYIEYITNDIIIEINDRKQYDSLNKDINKLEKKIEKLKSDIDNFEEKQPEELAILNELKQMHTKNLNKISNKKLKEKFEERSKYLKNLTIWYVGGFAAVFLMLPAYCGDNYSESRALVLCLISFIPLIISLFKCFKYIGMKKEIMNICDKSIKQFKSKHKNKKSNNNSEDKLTVIEEECNTLYEKRRKLIEKVIRKKLLDFHNFRLQHYNSQIEKFLLDYEFDKIFKKYFKTITKSQAKSNGDIDDYIDYFNTVINEK